MCLLDLVSDLGSLENRNCHLGTTVNEQLLDFLADFFREGGGGDLDKSAENSQFPGKRLLF